jgi:hypothetical protein
MFGLLYTGDAYKSQTEYLVSCTETYLKLCYRSACEIYDLAQQNKELLYFLMIKSCGTGPKNLERQKTGARLEDKIGEMYEELIIHSCTTKLYVTFSLESFINSFVTYLINHRILNNVKDEVKEIILHYYPIFSEEPEKDARHPPVIIIDHRVQSLPLLSFLLPHPLTPIRKFPWPADCQLP